MPVHDWSEVDTNVFHHFHQAWALTISVGLNARLPEGYSALMEQRSPQFEPDILALERTPRNRHPRNGGGTATLPMPTTRHAVETTDSRLAARGNRIAIHHRMGDIVCILEIVSPGNKSGRAAIKAFVDKTADFLEAGVHVVLIDLFPPNRLNPNGLHDLVWDQFGTDTFQLPPGEPMLLASYKAKGPNADDTTRAFLEPLGVGAMIPDMPAFLEPDFYVNVPLESTYLEAWNSCPKDMKYLVEHGKLPDE